MVTFLDISIIQPVQNVKSSVMEDAIQIRTISRNNMTVNVSVNVSLKFVTNNFIYFHCSLSTHMHSRFLQRKFWSYVLFVSSFGTVFIISTCLSDC